MHEQPNVIDVNVQAVSVLVLLNWYFHINPVLCPRIVILRLDQLTSTNTTVSDICTVFVLLFYCAIVFVLYFLGPHGRNGPIQKCNGIMGTSLFWTFLIGQDVFCEDAGLAQCNLRGRKLNFWIGPFCKSKIIKCLRHKTGFIWKYLFNNTIVQVDSGMSWRSDGMSCANCGMNWHWYEFTSFPCVTPASF